MKIRKKLTSLTKSKYYFKIKTIVSIAFGALLIAIGTYFFFAPSGLVTGGVGGIGILINNLTKGAVKTSWIIYAGNILFLLIGLITLGKKFFFKTVFATLLYPSFVLIFELVTNYNSSALFEINGVVVSETSKLILGTLFGAVVTGVGLGVIFDSNATSGGVDVLQKIINKYLNVPFSIAIYATDGIIVLSGLFAFSIENVLYSVIAVVLMGIIVDKITLSGKAGYTAFIIIQPEKVDELKNLIFENLDRGFTKVEVKGGFSSHDKQMVICSIRKNQVYDLKEIIENFDSDAFSFIVETKEVLGHGFKEKEGNE